MSKIDVLFCFGFIFFQVNINDAYSKNICEDCTFKLREASNFIQFAQRNDMILKHQNVHVDIAWPKPIQLDKTLDQHNLDNMCNKLMTEVKQEVLSDEEYHNNVNWAESVEIKVEPAESVQQPVPNHVNGM